MSDTSTVTNDVDIISKYKSLVSASLGADSAYIRAKETIQEFVDEGNLDEAQKADIVGSVLGGVVNNIASTSMSAALEWVKYEKELALKKIEMDLQLSILEQEKELKTSQVAQIEVQNRLSKVESRRMYGTGTFDTDGTILSLTEEGKVWVDMQLVSQQTVNASEENVLLGSKIKESQAAIHKVVADTYRNFGNFTFTYDSGGNGISSVTRLDAPGNTLSDTQQDIAVEQGKGYTYNAWANALTGSASMLGTAISSGDFDFSDGTTGDILIRTVINCANNLAVSSGANTEAIPVNKVSVPSNVT